MAQRKLKQTPRASFTLLLLISIFCHCTTPTKGQSCNAGQFEFFGTCIDCPVGTKLSGIPSDGPSACEKCTRGKYQSSAGSTTCVVCPSGFYSPLPSGTMWSDADSSLCEACPDGYLNGDDATSATKHYSCDHCDIVGKFASASTAASCDICPAGRWATAATITECKACPDGWFNDDAATNEVNHLECFSCPTIGRYTSKISSCKTCEAGRYSKIPFATSCLACPGGWFNADPGSDPTQHLTCTVACSNGEKSVSLVSQSCEICAAGKFLTVPASSCVRCPRGYFNNYAATQRDKHLDCTECAFDGYTLNEGTILESSCLKCAHGTGNTAPRSGCLICSIGKYSDSNGGFCKRCPIGYLNIHSGLDGSADEHKICSGCGSGTSNTGGQSTCAPCKSGRYSPGPSPCKVCDAGQFIHSGQRSCSSCPSGKVLEQSDELGAMDSIADCKTCIAGKAAHLKSVCKVCAAGKFSETEDSPCVNCAAGKFLTDPATDATFHTSTNQCLDCGAGKTSNTDAAGGASGCFICGAGKHANTLTTYPCKNCVAGKYLTDPGTQADLHLVITQCLDCDVGQKSNTDATGAADGCVVCGAGTYASTSGMYPCESCVGGKYLVDSGTDVSLHTTSSQCLECEAGQTSNTDAAADGCVVCDAGTIAIAPATYPCTVCNAGTYLTDDGSDAALHSLMDSCLECSAGMFLEDAAANAFNHDEASDCLDCPAGKFIGTASSASCTECPSGSISEVTKQTDNSACAECGVGEYKSSFSTCTSCPDGFVNPSLGQPSCTECAAGYFDDDTEICQRCDIGKFAQAGRTECTTCSSGRVQPSAGGGVCAACVAGQYDDGTTEVCHLCPIGYSSVTTSSSCSGCSFGKVQPVVGGAPCENCASGKYDGNDGEICTECPLGKQNPNPGRFGSGNCAACSTGGKYADQKGSTSCKICPAGFMSPCVKITWTPLPDYRRRRSRRGETFEATRSCGSIGLEFCSACPEGKFNNADGSEECTSCVAGKYQNTISSCESCPAGQYQNLPDAASCKECPKGFY